MGKVRIIFASVKLLEIEEIATASPSDDWIRERKRKEGKKGYRRERIRNRLID